MKTKSITVAVPAALWRAALGGRGHYPLAAHIRHDLDAWIADVLAPLRGLDATRVHAMADDASDPLVRTIELTAAQHAALKAACAVRCVSVAGTVRLVLAARVLRSDADIRRHLDAVDRSDADFARNIEPFLRGEVSSNNLALRFRLRMGAWIESALLGLGTIDQATADRAAERLTETVRDGLSRAATHAAIARYVAWYGREIGW